MLTKSIKALQRLNGRDSRTVRILIAAPGFELRAGLQRSLGESTYPVDVAETRIDAVREFHKYKHSVVIMDASFLPRSPSQISRLMYEAHREPIIIAATYPDQLSLALRHLREGTVFDILRLPVSQDRFDSLLNRALNHGLRHAGHTFRRDFLLVGALSLPVWLLGLVVLLIN